MVNPEESGSAMASVPPVTEAATIPDWLKESTSMVSQTEPDAVPPASEPEDIHPVENKEEVSVSGEIGDHTEPVAESVTPVPDAPMLPDWLKGTEGVVSEIPEEIAVTGPVSGESPIEELPTKEDIPEKEDIGSPYGDMSGLPDWMRGMDQESLKEEVKEEMDHVPDLTAKDAASYEDIPDWLRGVSLATTEPESIGSPENPVDIDQSVSPEKKESESKAEHKKSAKKEPKASIAKDE